MENIKEMIAYQTGSVVSKEVLRKKAGTITLFAFDKGQGLSEHTAPFDAVVYAVEGEATITINGKSHELKEGEMIIMPANKAHAVNAVTKFKMMLTMMRD
ncbi:MAG TPA: cupin domain-containing protein [Candidatus Aenigmarchaeota archaeon]|nr:cupin domain-containing protein [Candidatus Aenigmarchaeota archaeon]